MRIQYAKWIRRGRRRRGGSGLDIFHSEESPSGLLDVNDRLLESHNLRVLFWSYRETMGNVVTTVVCTERGGGTEPPEIGYGIDAFSINTGDFIDDPFVIVGPDHNLTQRANVEGFVPTARMENIEESLSIQEFVDWRVWNNAGENSVADPNLSAPAGASAIAFAFYRNPVVNNLYVPGPIRFKVPFYVPPETWHQFETGLLLAGDAIKFSKELRTEILALSAKMVSSASKSMTQGIMNVAEGDKKLASKFVGAVVNEAALTSAVVTKKK